MNGDQTGSTPRHGVTVNRSRQRAKTGCCHTRFNRPKTAVLLEGVPVSSLAILPRSDFIAMIRQPVTLSTVSVPERA